jgi:hypothetical protein
MNFLRMRPGREALYRKARYIHVSLGVILSPESETFFNCPISALLMLVFSTLRGFIGVGGGFFGIK